MTDVSPRYVRNLGFLSAEEQVRLQNARIAIAGGGGDGGEIARLLVRMGVGCGPSGEIRLADPETFEIENVNRQTACTQVTIGQNKAAAVGELLTRINPDLNLRLYTDGVTVANVEKFVAGADLVIDESDYTRHEIGVMISRACRKSTIPVLMGMNIGFAGIVTTFDPRGPRFEEHLGFTADQPIDEIRQAHVPLSRWAPYLPGYGDFSVLSKVASGEKPAPSIAAGMSAAASTTTTEALWNLLARANHRPKPVYFKRVLVVDPAARVAKTISFTAASHYRHGAVVWLRNRMGYPSTDY